MNGRAGGAATRTGTNADGFTVVELTIAMGIAMVVMASLMGLLTSQSKAAARTENFANNQEDARLGLVALQRDLRSAESIIALPEGVDPSFQIELKVYASSTAVTPDTIRWRITPGLELLRETVVSATNVAVTYSLAGVSNLATGVPLLAYYSPQSITPYSNADSARAIAGCTVRVRIDLRAAPRPGPAPVRLVSDVQLRNRIARAGAC